MTRKKFLHRFLKCLKKQVKKYLRRGSTCTRKSIDELNEANVHVTPLELKNKNKAID